MGKTITEQLAEFTSETEFPHLPTEVVEECMRILLDSVGCALAAVDQPKGRIGIEYGRLIGGADGDATIIGAGSQTSIFGASFANGELISAMDFDAVLPPGHVAPYVLPGALAVGESRGCSGTELVTAVAVSHEMSYRFGKAMDHHRDIKDGKISLPSALGFTSTVFGATAAIGKLKGYSSSVLAHALGVAGSITPVNSYRSMVAHAPSSTIKYTMAGVVAQTALTAAHMAELGHRGDLEVLDDTEFGYRRFIGTSRWEPGLITSGLGVDWRFPAEHSYKPYPHCRVLHAPLDTLIQLVDEHDIKPEEIDAIHAWGEAWIEQPIWLNKTIEHIHDGQFSVAHGLAVGAHRVPPGKAWQDPDLVFSRSVLELMDKVDIRTPPRLPRRNHRAPSQPPFPHRSHSARHHIRGGTHFSQGLPLTRPRHHHDQRRASCQVPPQRRGRHPVLSGRRRRRGHAQPSDHRRHRHRDAAPPHRRPRSGNRRVSRGANPSRGTGRGT